MLKNFKAEYKTMEAPIKNCSFTSSSGADIGIYLDETRTNCVSITIDVPSSEGRPTERVMSYNKEDFIALMNILRNIENQLL